MKKRIPFILLLGILIFISAGCKKKVKEVVIQDKAQKLKTIENIRASIFNEQNSSDYYSSCAKKAMEENYGQINILFETISKSEWIHLNSLKEILRKYNDSIVVPVSSFNIRTTPENLEEAIKNEGEVIDNVLPDYIKTAKEEKVQDAKKTFNWIMQTEMKHHRLLKNALNYLNKMKLKKIAISYYVCPKCGNIYSTKYPLKCEVCKTHSDKFINIK